MTQYNISTDFVSILPDRLASKALLLFKGNERKNVEIKIKDDLGNLISKNKHVLLKGEKVLEYKLGLINPGKYLLSISSDHNHVNLPIYKA